ncbi:MAG: DUF262 domain-containing protein [Fusobacteriaceae bacterium]
MKPNLPYQILDNSKIIKKKFDISEISKKYKEGEVRIITESGSYKLPLLRDIFNSAKYELNPSFQRRLTWNKEKKSKLIETFIMNIPVPPVFLYEIDYDKYEVMDGLQRISTIIDFYDDKFELSGLEEWPELNEMRYSALPKTIKDGIDRRQLSSLTLLKESAKDDTQAEKMKKLVFERLNTGGVKLEDQEIRNALYPGVFNELCFELSGDENFKKLWKISSPCSKNEENSESNKLFSILENIEDNNNIDYTKHKLYIRMYDVELVLRFFGMLNIEYYTVKLSSFLDNCLISGNKCKKNDIEECKQYFKKIMKGIYDCFGDKGFCQYKDINNKKKWSEPLRTIYDPILVAFFEIDFSLIKGTQEVNQKKLEEFYIKNEDNFSGKNQAKSNIEQRKNIFIDFLNELIVQNQGEN